MKKILICDDDQNIREILEMVITIEFEVEITMAIDGLDAIAKLKENPSFDLIISDNNMPLANGIDVYNFNKINASSPFILLSGDGEGSIAEFEGFNENPYNSVVPKPWEDHELMDAVKPVLSA